MIKDKKLGVWLRPNTCDVYVPGQINQYKALELEGNNILDLGGHIGCFAVYAHLQGANNITSFEPHPSNCVMFRLNTFRLPNIKLIQKAVTAHGGDRIPFYESTTDTSAHSVVPIRGRNEITADTASLEEALTLSSASIVKLDIEGSEYILLPKMAELFPDLKVKMFAAELHLNLKDWRLQALNFVDVMEKYYTPVIPAKIGPKNWNTTGIWRLR